MQSIIQVLVQNQDNLYTWCPQKYTMPVLQASWHFQGYDGRLEAMKEGTAI